jgi:hypothetical protein
MSMGWEMEALLGGLKLCGKWVFFKNWKVIEVT